MTTLQTGEELQQQDMASTAVSEVAVQRQSVGLGGYASTSHAASEEDMEMPDITREKFPYAAAIAGMLLFQAINCYNAL